MELDPFGALASGSLITFREYKLTPETYAGHVATLARMMVQIPESELDISRFRIFALQYFQLNSIPSLEFENWSYSLEFQLLGAKLEMVKRILATDRTVSVVGQIATVSQISRLEDILVNGVAVWSPTDSANVPTMEAEFKNTYRRVFIFRQNFIIFGRKFPKYRFLTKNLKKHIFIFDKLPKLTNFIFQRIFFVQSFDF